MAKKHYELIAAVLLANAAPRRIVMALADAFKQDNAKFDRSRFIRAATP
jgi:hypothetical protein